MEAILPTEATMLLAGLAGALVFAFIRPERESLVKAIGNLVVGTVTSFWLTPALADWRDWSNLHGRHAAAFVVGLVGLVGCRLIVQLAESETATRLFKRMLGWPDDERRNPGPDKPPGPGV